MDGIINTDVYRHFGCKPAKKPLKHQPPSVKAVCQKENDSFAMAAMLGTVSQPNNYIAGIASVQSVTPACDTKVIHCTLF